MAYRKIKHSSGVGKLQGGVWDRLPHIFEQLNLKGIWRIDPEWLPTPAFLLQRTTNGEIVEDCGKGLNLNDALRSVIFEAIERSAAEVYNESKFLRGRFCELSKVFPCCSPVEFHVNGGEYEDAELNWVPGRDLLHQTKVYVPADCVYFPYRSLFFPVSTTGLAAGTNQEQTVLHAIFEVIEHDTLSIYYYTGLPGRELELVPGDGCLYTVYHRLVQEGIGVKVQYLDNDLHIPTVLVVFQEILALPGVKVAGVGCHLDPVIALRRALTECCQSAGFWYYRYCRNEMEENKVFHPPLYLSSPYVSNREPLKLSALTDHSRGNVKADLDEVLQRLQKTASRVIVVDLTREELPFPSLRVIIPEYEDLLTDNPQPRRRAQLAKEAVQRYIGSVKCEV